MINKFYKTIHNKYSIFFRFIFLIRYLFAIFLTSLALFLIIPNFFNYEKRVKFIKTQLLDSYNLEISKYEKIKFKSFPVPSLELNNVKIRFQTSDINSDIRRLTIYPKFISIYNYENFQINKIILKESSIILKASDFKHFIKNLLDQKNKLFLNNLDLKINNENESIIKFKSVKFANYGYKKNLIYGKIFEKKFQISKDENLKKIDFKLNDLGISAIINFNADQREDFKSGVLKAKILNTKLKFNFDYNNKILKIYNSYLRSKNLNLNNDILINLNPFLEINSKVDVQEFNPYLFENLNLDKLLETKGILKKINSKNEINFKSKKFTSHLIDNLNLKFDLAYGRVNFLKKFSISNNFFQCKGNINLLEDYPLAFFDCNIMVNDKQKFLKLFSIKTNEKNKVFKLNTSGSLNILSKKINFKLISINNDYDASKEDMIYFKSVFESILFEENFIKIFKMKKIKKFIQEVS